MDTLTITNNLSVEQDGWAQLAVTGEFPARAVIRQTDGSMSRADVIQRIDAASIDAMVSAFNSPWGRVKRFLKGCFIFNGHPDVPGSGDGDPEPKGMIAALEARPNGLWCQPVFTDAGKSMLDGAKLYFSAVWTSQQVDEANGVPIFQPTRLISAGLTTTPNLPVQLLNSAAAGIDSKPNQTTEKTMNKKLLIALLANRAPGITEDSPDDQFQQAISGALSEGAQAATTLANVRAELETERAKTSEERQGRITETVSAAVLLGKILPQDTATWIGRLKENFNSARAELDKLTTSLKTTAVTVNMANRKNTFVTDGGDIAKFHRLVQEKMTAGLDYRQAFTAATEQFPGLVNLQ